MKKMWVLPLSSGVRLGVYPEIVDGLEVLAAKYKINASWRAFHCYP